jgi:hypothetical protein
MGRKAKITSADRIAREQRTAAIVQMRLQGFTLREIGAAQHPPVSNVAIYKTIRNALDRMATEATEQARRLEEMRCDELLAGGLYERALNGDLQAVNGVLAVMAKRSRLLGLDAQPVRFGSASDGYNEGPKVRIEIIADEERANAEQAARAVLGLGPHLN